MITIKYLLSTSFLFLVLALTGCSDSGGGGGGGSSSVEVFSLDGAPVSGSYDPDATTPVTYSFNVVTGTAYTVNLVSTSGHAGLQVFDADPNLLSAASLGVSNLSVSTLEQVSFVAAYDGQAFIVPSANGGTSASYTVQATSNNLTVDGAAKTASAYETSLYYSFDAVADSAYEVILAPSAGDVNIGAVSSDPTMIDSRGSSSNTGTTVDSLYVSTISAQRFYIRVASTSVDSTFAISVRKVPSAPDLRVVIDSVSSDGTDAFIDYTVYNHGVEPYVGELRLDAWADADTAPTIGSTSPDFATLAAGTTIEGLGGSIPGRLTVATVPETGTAYVIVDTLNAVAESNETNNVSSATSWEKPIQAPAIYGFEDAAIPAKTRMSGDSAWGIDSSDTGAGSDASSGISLRSGTITHNESSCFAFDAYNSQGVVAKFDLKVSSASLDYLIFYIDGTEIKRWSGGGGELPWETASSPASAGQHEYKWCYTKNYISDGGTDQAWIDNIFIGTTTSELRATVDNVSSDGTNVTIDYTVYNDSDIIAPGFAVDVWSHAASAPNISDLGETTVSHAKGLAGGGTVSGTVTIPNAATTTGTAYAIVDTSDVVLESNERDNVSAGVIWGLADLNVVVDYAIASGTDVKVTYTVSNTGLGAAGAFNVDIWEDPDAATPPTIGDVGSFTDVVSSLAAGSSVSLTVTIPNTNITAGTAYAIVDTANVVPEVDETNNVSLAFAWEAQTVPGAVSYDFETGIPAVPAAINMSGNTGWLLDSANSSTVIGTVTGTKSLTSGILTHNQQSCASIISLSSTSIDFDYQVSSESGYDKLRFSIDGVEQDTWSGDVAWANAVYVVSSGSHEYKWCYTKDASVDIGGDAAWIDNIIIN